MPPPDHPITGVDHATAKRVRDRHQDEILPTYRAIGIGLGGAPGTESSGRLPLDAPVWVIAVFLRRSADLPREPQTFEGVPLTFTVTGDVHIGI